MIKLNFTRHGRDISFTCTATGGFALIAVLVLNVVLGGHGAEVVGPLLDLILAILK